MALVRRHLPKDQAEATQHNRLLWEAYSQEQRAGETQNHTRLFFDAIPKSISLSFNSSTKRILQLGMGNGKFLAESAACKTRECIGYDYSKTGVAGALAAGIVAREIDLNETVSTGQLAYQDVLTADLSVPTDIIAIRVFEYLEPDALVLLIFSLLNTAKKDSIFYFDIFKPYQHQLPKSLFREIEDNYIASFFPRTDVTFLDHSINVEGIGKDKGTSERLIILKYR